MSDGKTLTAKRAYGLQTGHIAGLDGLRGIAIIAVTLYHLFPDVIKGGFLGVSLFFVLTGYLLTVTSERSYDKGNFHISSYYKKRIRRIYPALLLVIFMTIGALKILTPDVLNGIQHEVFSIIFGYNNIWQISQNSSYFAKIANSSPFTHLWFLSIEIQFYILWPLFFLVYQKIRKSRHKSLSNGVFILPALLSMLALIILFEPGQDATRVYYGTDTRVFSLFLGAFVGAHQKDFRNYKWSGKRKRTNIIRFIFFMLIVLVSFVFMDGQSDFTYRIGLIASSLIFCLILKYAVNPQLPIGKFLDCKLLSWIGKISYEIYLWQFPVIFIFRYLKLNSVYYILLTVGLILVLSVWLHMFLNVISGKIKLGGSKFLKSLQRFIVTTTALVFAVVCCFGIFSTIIAPDTKKESQEQLRKELDINSQKLKEQSSVTTSNSTAVNANTNNEQYKSITAVGDSVMLGASSSIQKLIPDCIIDAEESRQVDDSQDIFNSLSNSGRLGDIVIVGLGTNGSFDLKTGQSLIDSFGKNRVVYWITAYGEHLQWQDKTNSVIYKLAEINSNVNVIDWAKYANSHSDWFYDDGIHLSSEGQRAYAELILQNIPKLSKVQSVDKEVTDVKKN